MLLWCWSICTDHNLANEARTLQSWFLKIIFYVPKLAPNLLLQRLSGLNSIESEIALRKLLFLGRLIKEPKMAQSGRSLFMSRVESHFDAGVISLGGLPSITEALNKYDLFHFFVSWFHDSTFPVIPKTMAALAQAMAYLWLTLWQVW